GSRLSLRSRRKNSLRRYALQKRHRAPCKLVEGEWKLKINGECPQPVSRTEEACANGRASRGANPSRLRSGGLCARATNQQPADPAARPRDARSHGASARNIA